MKCALIAVCDHAIIDARTNNLSLINIIQDINAVAFPAFHPKAVLAMMLDRANDEPVTTNATVRLVLNGNSIFESEVPVDFKGHVRVRSVIEIQGIELVAPGTLRVSLYHNNAELGVWSLNINQIGSTQVLSSAPAS